MYNMIIRIMCTHTWTKFRCFQIMYLYFVLESNIITVYICIYIYTYTYGPGSRPDDTLVYILYAVHYTCILTRYRLNNNDNMRIIIIRVL